MAHRLRRQGATHRQADVQGLRQLGVGPAQVEDLLDTMVNSFEAVLRHRHGQRHELLVLPADGPVGEHLLLEGLKPGKSAHPALQDLSIQPLLPLHPLGPAIHVMPPSAQPKTFSAHHTFFSCVPENLKVVFAYTRKEVIQWAYYTGQVR